MKATPEQQQQYDAVMLAARGIIYSDQGAPMVLQKLAGGRDNLGETIGHTAAMILSSVKGGIENKGRQVPNEILFHADQELVADLVEIADASNMLDGADKKKVSNEAFLNSAKTFSERQKQPQQPQQAPPQTGGIAAPPQPAQQPGLIAAAQGA
jgi:hypothetical protein